MSDSEIKEKKAARKIRQRNTACCRAGEKGKPGGLNDTAVQWGPGTCGGLFFSGLSAPNTVKLHTLPSKPTENARLPSAVGFLFPDSLVKNSMSGHPWHTNLPSIPHLAHLWQQYGLRLYPLPPLVNMLKQMFYDPRLSASHISIALWCASRFVLYLPPSLLKAAETPRVALKSAQPVIHLIFLLATVR